MVKLPENWTQREDSLPTYQIARQFKPVVITERDIKKKYKAQKQTPHINNNLGI